MNAPAPRRTKVFVSYSHDDGAYMEALRKHLTLLGEDAVWIDTQAIEAGEQWEQEIRTGLETARAAVLLLSADFFSSRYIQETELPCLLTAAEKGHVTLVPVFVSPCNPGKLGKLQAINSPERTLADLKDNPAEQARVWMKVCDRIQAILSGAAASPAVGEVVQPAAVEPVPGSTSEPPLEPPAATALVEALAERLAFENLTIFLGSDLAALDPGAPESDEQPPLRLFELARGLLEDLDFGAASGQRLLLPLDVVSTYFAVRKGERSLESRLCDMVSERRLLTPAHRALARLLHTLGELERAGRFARRGQRPGRLVVTTNVDLLTERALLLAGVPFVRLVQDRSGEKIIVNVYESIVSQGVDWLLLASGKEQKRVRRDDLDGLCEVITELGREELVYRGGARQEVAEASQNPLRTLALEQYSPQVFLYKFHGSEDVRNSCAISIDQHLRLVKAVLSKNVVPLKITEFLSSGPALVLGYGLLDPPFRVLLHTLPLETGAEVGESKGHYLVQLPPRDDDPDEFRRLEQQLWPKIKELAGRYGLEVLEQRGDAFLDQLSQALTKRWGG